jgi:hypothetical protein
MDVDDDDEDDEEDGEPTAKRHRTEPPVPETPAPSTHAQVASSAGSTSVISVPRQKVPTTVPVVEIQVSPIDILFSNDLAD